MICYMIHFGFRMGMVDVWVLGALVNAGIRCGGLGGERDVGGGRRVTAAASRKGKESKLERKLGRIRSVSGPSFARGTVHFYSLEVMMGLRLGKKMVLLWNWLTLTNTCMEVILPSRGAEGVDFCVWKKTRIGMKQSVLLQCHLKAAHLCNWAHVTLNKLGCGI